MIQMQHVFVLDTSVQFQTLVVYYRRVCPILDSTVRIWTLVSDFRHYCPIKDISDES